MKQRFGIVALILAVALCGCKKDDDDGENPLPDGAVPYTEANIQFVPYNSGDETFDRVPLLDSSFSLVLKERLRTEEYFAWDQTFFYHESDTNKVFELRLRYMQTDISQKTLAIYTPYEDANGELQQNLFEMPIETPSLIDSGFFANIVDFYDTLTLNSVEFYDVYRVEPLQPTVSSKDGPENYNLLYYNQVYGIIQLEQKDGSKWFLDQ